MIEMHLYGRLRRFTNNEDPSRDSILHIPVENGVTIEDIIRRAGIPRELVGTNLFLNGEYSPPGRKVKDGDRLGVFPYDIDLLMI